MVGLDGAGETKGSRIWGIGASWLMIMKGVRGRPNAQRDRLKLCSCCRAVERGPHQRNGLGGMYALVDSGPGRWAKTQED